MYFTYVIFSPASSKIYIGQTHDLERRINTHNSPENDGWTKKFHPWTLLFFETFGTRAEAMKREKELKSAQGRAYIRNQISNLI